jgi:hypothetical protein
MAGCFMPDGYVPDYAKDTRKEFWYGCHLLTVRDMRIKSIKSFHMSELKDLYGKKERPLNYTGLFNCL